MIKLHDKLAQVRAAREEGEKGFTLIELLVVVIIIGILAAIAIPIFLGQQENAKGSAVESALANAKTNIVSAIVETGEFPDSASTPTLAAILTDSAGNTDITLSAAATSGPSGFCLSGTHAEVEAGARTWAVDDNGGVIEDATCVGVVATPN